jgi:DNA-binding Lrp family transcriptional regulator
MSGAFDFTVILEAKTMKEISKFVFEKLATLDYVQSTATHFILRKYKDFKTVLVEEKKDLREMVNL